MIKYSDSFIMEGKKYSSKTVVTEAKTPNPITMYNAVSLSEPIYRSASYMKKYTEMSDAKRYELYAENLDIIHYVKDVFDPSKTYSREQAVRFLKAYNTVVHIKKYGIWNMKRLLLKVTDPAAKTSRRGWKIHYEIEQSIEELMRIESDFRHLIAGAQYVAK
jgi:hypothetical protein